MLTIENPVAVAIIGGIFLALSALIGWISARGKTKADAKTALDARIDARVERQLADAWTKLDEQGVEIEDLKEKAKEAELRESRRTSAFTRILRAIAEQWPDNSGPDLDPADIAEVEDTIPTGWIRRASIGHSRRTRTETISLPPPDSPATSG